MKYREEIFDFSETSPASLEVVDNYVYKSLKNTTKNDIFYDLLKYQKNKDAILPIETSSNNEHLSTAYEWLDFLGIKGRFGKAILTTGVLHSQYIVLSCLTNPGDTILTEEVTSSAIKAVAKELNLKIKGVKSDEEGPCGDDLKKQIQKHAPKVVILMSNFTVPTGRSMSLDRRKKIAKVLKESNVSLFENDVFGSLIHDKKPPISAFAPEISFYATSMSKVVSPALRVGFLAVPFYMYLKILNLTRLTTWMVSPVLMNIVSGLIRNGDIHRIIKHRIGDLLKRGKIFKNVFKKNTEGIQVHFETGASNAWITLPQIGKETFADFLYEKNIITNTGKKFIIENNSNQDAIRLCLTNFKDLKQLEKGLLKIKEYLEERISKKQNA